VHLIAGHTAFIVPSFLSIETGLIQSIHRKLHPTYEESLVWEQGDGYGLVVNYLGALTVDELNCYENCMAMACSALYAQGESLHVGVCFGGLHNTKGCYQITWQSAIINR
jgi:nitrilase